MLEASAGRAPSRVDAISVRLELDVEGGNERLRQTLQRVAESCPVGNTLRLPPRISVELVLNEQRATSGER